MDNTYIYTVEPQFTNAPHHEQIGLQTIFPNKKGLISWSVLRYEHVNQQHRGTTYQEDKCNAGAVFQISDMLARFTLI